VGISVSRVGGDAQIKAMKRVAGSLRLDLAQYRELEAFAQFGSDLDPATLRQLERGARLVEILKQDQYVPMAVEKQVAVIFCGTEGLLDDIPVHDIRRFETEYLEFMDAKYAGLLADIKGKGDLDDELKKRLRAAAEEFKARFKPSEEAA